jgi:hypothetical protein
VATEETTMHDNLLAQARGLRTGIEKLDNEITTLRQDLERIEADRLAMARELGSVERCLDGEGIPVPYSDRGGIQ